jgi:tetratricopeptide (TPR) repeat protein
MNNQAAIGPDFFVAGGTLRPKSGSYVHRPADDDLFKLIQEGTFCYVLTSRQMGKSSLMMRTAQQLKEAGVQTAIIDLTRVGTVAVDQWYLGMLTLIKRQLRLSANVEAWWAEHVALGPVQRFTDFLRDVALTEIEGNIAIFIDEIDSTLNLDFTDDFFAAIRALYNARTDDPAFNRLTFVLLGVATPSDLIKDRSRTPFNIGRAIILKDFNRADAGVLQAGMEQIYPDRGQAIFERVYYWTNGHPYLTQKLCLGVAEKPEQSWNNEQIDTLVEKLFLSESEEARSETNLKFIRENISDNPERRQLLSIYRQVYLGKSVPEDERSLDQNRLKLLGLVRAEKGQLHVRNNIYRQAFNLAWIKANMPADRNRQFAWAASIVAVVLAIILGIFIWQQGARTIEAQAHTYEEDFKRTTNPTLRLGALSGLFSLTGYDEAGYELFNSLSPAEKEALFTNIKPDVQPQVRQVVKGVYTKLADTEEDNHLLETMRTALTQTDEAESTILANEIARWLQGRAATAGGDYAEAQNAYNLAIEWNDENPATYFERGLVRAELGDHTNGLADLEAAVDLNESWQAPVSQAVQSKPDLHVVAWEQRETYQTVAALITQPADTPTPSQTPTPSPTPTEIPPTSTPSPTSTPTARSTDTPTPTSTPSPTSTPLPAAPAVSRRTYQLVYTKWDGGQHNLYVADTNGENELFLFGRVAGPSWSADGAYIYFYGEPGVDRQERGGVEYLFDGVSNGIIEFTAEPLPTGLDQIKLFQANEWKQGTARWANVSPNGQIIAYDARPGGDYRIYFFDAVDVYQYPYEIVGEQADWSPDSQSIVYRSGRDGKTGIWISGWNDTGHTNVTNDSSDAFPAWSPDGETIAFSRDAGGNIDIYTISPDGSNLQQLTDTPGPDTLPVYTPDGDIVFRSARSGSWGIWKMSRQGEAQTEILPNAGVGPDWSFSRMDVK